MKASLPVANQNKRTIRWNGDYIGRVMKAFGLIVRLDGRSLTQLSALLSDPDLKRVGKFQLKQVKGRVYVACLSGQASSFGPFLCVQDAVRLYQAMRSCGMAAVLMVVLALGCLTVGRRFKGIELLETQNVVSSPEISGKKSPTQISSHKLVGKTARETFPQPERDLPFHGSAPDLFAALVESSRLLPKAVRFVGIDQVPVGEGLAIKPSGMDLNPILAKLNLSQNSAVFASAERWAQFGANLRLIAVFGQRVVLWPTSPDLLDRLASAPTGQKVNMFTVPGWIVVIYDDRLEVVEWSTL